MATTVTVNTSSANFTITITESSASPGSLNNWADLRTAQMRIMFRPSDSMNFWADQAGSSGIKLTQLVVQVLREGSPTIRLSQEVIQVLHLTPANIRLSQLVIQVLKRRSVIQPRITIMT